MLMGQSIALAAEMALEKNCPVQSICPETVAEKMAALGVVGIAGRPL